MDTSHSVTLPSDMPRAMRQLPRDEVGRPIPFFVAIVDGKPDFRVMDPHKVHAAHHHRLCFLCGEPLHRSSAVFTVGPMCVINRVSAEPPNHSACATWSVKACPFLAKPAKVRRETNLPDNVGPMGGVMITRNPGVTALVLARDWVVELTPTGPIWRMQYLRDVAWYAEGRLATRTEVLEAIDSGLPLLREMAAEEGPEAVRQLDVQVENMQRWLP